MGATLKLIAERFASEIANQAKPLDNVNGLVCTRMKSALERMLDTEMHVHLGRKSPPPTVPANGFLSSRRLRATIEAIANPRKPSVANCAKSRSTRYAIATVPLSPKCIETIWTLPILDWEQP